LKEPVYGFTARRIEYNSRVSWLVESTIFIGCIGEGKTIKAALKEFVGNEDVFIEDYIGRGEQLLPNTTILDDDFKFTTPLSTASVSKIDELREKIKDDQYFSVTLGEDRTHTVPRLREVLIDIVNLIETNSR